MRALPLLFLLVAPASFAHSIKGKVALPGGKSAENSVVFIASIDGKTFAPPAETAVMDQKNKAFAPHVLVVMKGQKVKFPNTDVMRHNVFSPSKVHKFNLGIFPPGTSKEELFDKPGVVSLLCNVHPEMSGFILVVETPYFSLLGKDGTFELKDVPAGKYEVTAWHEGLPTVEQTVEVKGNATVNFTLKRS
jgi:plastocyanin